MTALPFFSIVIPLYNKGPHVARAIDSVLHQTCGDFELLVINDASTDSGLDELGRFTDPRIRVYRREKPGVGGYAARNLGIQHSIAPWVAFLDADDSWDARHLSNMRRLSERFPAADLLACGWNLIDAHQSRPDPYYQARQARGPHIVSTRDYLREILNGRPPIWTSAAVIRKRALDQCGGFPEDMCERGGDTVLWIKLVLQDRELAWLPYLGANYFMNSVNRVSRSVPSSMYDSGPVRYIADYLEKHPADPHRAALLRARSQYICWNFQMRLLHGGVSLPEVLSVRRHASLASFLLMLLAFAVPSSFRSSCWRCFHALKGYGCRTARRLLR